MIQTLPTDTLFSDSPNAGEPNCICSRCGNKIQEDECPIRIFTTNDKDEVDENSKEYRYCKKCSFVPFGEGVNDGFTNGIIITVGKPDIDLTNFHEFIDKQRKEKRKNSKLLKKNEIQRMV